MGLKSKIKYFLKQFPFIYPRRIINSCEDWIINGRTKKGTYFNQRGPWYKTIFTEDFILNTRPKTLGTPNDRAFSINRSYYTGKASLFYLQNSYVFGHFGLVLNNNHEVFQEFSHHFHIASVKKLFWRYPFLIFTKKTTAVPAVGAVLISPNSHNYYHWLSDVLPRIKLYESVIDQIDYFCIASNVPAKFLEILPDFGIPHSKILLLKQWEKLHFSHLFVASLPGSEGRSPRWAIDYLRSKLVKEVSGVKASKNIYFMRNESAERRILNEKNLLDMLEKEGFEIVDPDNLSIYEQIALMSQAKIVIGAHGAALANSIFLNENSALIEIFSPDYFRSDCYFTTANILNINYYYLQGIKPENAAWGDITIDEKLLKETITEINNKAQLNN